MNEKIEEANNRELYALLHVSPEASDEEIRRAYRQWAQVYHPDKYQSSQVRNPYSVFSFITIESLDYSLPFCFVKLSLLFYFVFFFLNFNCYAAIVH